VLPCRSRFQFQEKPDTSNVPVKRRRLQLSPAMYRYTYAVDTEYMYKYTSIYTYLPANWRVEAGGAGREQRLRVDASAGSITEAGRGHGSRQ
jgi:hypothetical protein